MENKIIKSIPKHCKYEVRCRSCGKKFFDYYKRDIEIEKNRDIIVTRCTRCKNDNIIII